MNHKEFDGHACGLLRQRLAAGALEEVSPDPAQGGSGEDLGCSSVETFQTGRASKDHVLELL